MPTPWPAWWPLGRSRRVSSTSGASTAAAVGPPAAVSLPAGPEAAWRDLPQVQRTLAEPLRPVAIGDDFRQSLASFTDPSFMAPLTHQVDPSTGGLVDGLALPGRPYAHPGAADLPVPAREAGPAAPRVQRSVGWSGSPDLPTVSWELLGAAADETVPWAPESPSTTSGPVEPTDTAAAPTVGGPVSAPELVSTPVQRSLSAVPTRPGPAGVVPAIAVGELPVVARAPEARATSDAPVVSRLPDPAAESAPLSGFAAAITSLAGAEEESAGPADDPAAAPGSDESASSAIQRMAADPASIRSDSTPAPAVEPASGGWSGPPLVSGAATVGPLAASTRQPADAPTLGPRLAHSPLAVPRASLTGRAAVPAEPAVQRVEFLNPSVAAVRPSPPPAPTPVPILASAANADDAAPTSVAELRTGVTAQPSLISPASPSAVAGPSRSAMPPVQRLAEPDSSPALTDRPTGSLDLRVEPDPEDGPVPTELWTPAPAPPVLAAVASAPSVQARFGPGPAAPVPLRMASAAATPASDADAVRRVGSSPMVTVGPSIPVQRSAAHATEAAADPLSTGAPLIVSRQASADLPPGATRSGGAVSFANMFGPATSTQPAAAETTGDDGFRSVQRAPDDTAAPASEPAGGPAASPPTVSSAAPPAGAAAAPTDLDEMARRLYEPLSARLRAELWLDRERAGAMSDA